MAGTIPLVNYLVPGPQPRLTANRCVGCGAVFFDRRNACANCSGIEFDKVEIAPEGIVEAFTIVHFAAPDVSVPFVAATFNCGGVLVRGNITGVDPSPSHIKLGMKVRLVTNSLGQDPAGNEGIGMSFEPVDLGEVT